MTHAPLDADVILSRLQTARVGRDVRVFDELESTNQYALQDPGPDADGLVVLAERQTRGRGRLGRAWRCPRGAGLLCTVCITDEKRQIDSNLLSLIIPVALCEAIHAATRVRCEIKWPNDLIAAGCKLGGVLIEGRSSGATQTRYAIGFGINCLQQRSHFDGDLAGAATSLELQSPHPIDRTEVLIQILTRIDAALTTDRAWQADEVCRRWKQHALPIGGRVELTFEDRQFSGHVIDIDPTAALVVQLDRGGRRHFPASATSMLKYTP